MRRWLLYGANGYTGELIARETRKRGLQPVLASRNLAAVKPLACVRTRTHYLDITGEMDVFAYARQIDGLAPRAGAHMPATLSGADLITRLPGSSPLTISTPHATEGTHQ
ncbi:hypothetical protein [Actinomadura fibrosa]|uniref:Saccharopine dehydrogenase NADP binding domain-containing protein n=1 Tax=Actinomadura fibrosa TaxID=111802 RepID=A0ABW2Y120_9ACTN|nr:hypothetical protein [Actinomadura fibrosa]